MCDKKENILDRLRKLIDDSGKSRPQIAKDLKCDASTITKHYNGDRGITSDFVVKYAKYFNVSTDYLLGLTDTPTIDTDKRYICEYTGLDSIAVADLHRLKLHEATSEIAILNLLIKSYIIVEIAKWEQEIYKSTEKQIEIYKQIIQSYYNVNDFELPDLVIELILDKEPQDDIDFYKYKSQKKTNEWLSMIRRKEESELNNYQNTVDDINDRYNYYRNFTDQNAESVKRFKKEIEKYLSLSGIEIPKGEDNGDDQETQ